MAPRSFPSPRRSSSGHKMDDQNSIGLTVRIRYYGLVPCQPLIQNQSELRHSNTGRSSPTAIGTKSGVVGYIELWKPLGSQSGSSASRLGMGRGQKGCSRFFVTEKSWRLPLT